MGIKFQCPNGHSLNVKTFLAGKRGICPHCQSRFIIPLESGGQASPAPSKQQPEAASGTFTSAAVQTPESRPGASSPALASNGVSHSSAEKSSLAGTAFEPTRGPIQYGFPANLPVGTLQQPTLPVGTQLSDPIDEAPQAVWYVRPPSGGQFGPAVGEIMRTWIAEGRVSADSWVWREGWTDWRQAGTVLPQLVPAAATVSPVKSQVEDSPTLPQPADETTATQVRVRSRLAANQLTLILVALLILVAIGLVGIFMWVVGQQKETAAAPRDALPASIVTAPFSPERVASSLG